MIILGYFIESSFIYWMSVIFVASMLTYEQNLVKENDLSKLDLAFFTLNGWVSMGFLGFMVMEKVF